MQTGKAISIPSILKVGNGTLNKIGEYLKSEELTSVVIFMGNGLIDMFGDTIMKSLTDAGITVLEYSELDTVEIDDIITLAFDIPNKAKAVVSVGGGKVIDAGKYAAFLRNLPLSVCRPQAQAMVFLAPVHHFWCTASVRRFLQSLRMVS